MVFCTIKRVFFFCCFFTFISTYTLAQPLTQGDSLEIQNKARFCIRQFEDILNQLAKPDDIFRTYNVDNFISKFYESTSNDQIFRDSAILMEDDLHPGSRSPTFEKEKPVKRYLLDFYQFYGKSSGVSVIFSNIQISDVQQGDYLYVNVIYESEFLNRHKYIDIPYTKHKKIATVKAELMNNGWKALITFIGFYKAPAIEKEEAAILEDTEKKQGDSIWPISEDTISVIETNTEKEGTIINVDDAYKRGNAFSISWNDTFENPVSLRLYQGDTFRRDLASSITTTKYSGVIPKKARPGEGYNFQLYDPQTKTTLESGSFQIRRKIPLGLQIPVYVGAGVLIYFLINGGGDGGNGDDCPPNCPEPDLPDPVNPYGN
jgi:hypothetical protein